MFTVNIKITVSIITFCMLHGKYYSNPTNIGKCVINWWNSSGQFKMVNRIIIMMFGVKYAENKDNLHSLWSILNTGVCFLSYILSLIVYSTYHATHTYNESYWHYCILLPHGVHSSSSSHPGMSAPAWDDHLESTLPLPQSLECEPWWIAPAWEENVESTLPLPQILAGSVISSCLKRPRGVHCSSDSHPGMSASVISSCLIRPHRVHSSSSSHSAMWCSVISSCLKRPCGVHF